MKAYSMRNSLSLRRIIHFITTQEAHNKQESEVFGRGWKEWAWVIRAPIKFVLPAMLLQTLSCALTALHPTALENIRQ